MSVGRLKELTIDALRDQLAQIPDELKQSRDFVLAMLIVQCALGDNFLRREFSDPAVTSSEFLGQRRTILTIHSADLIWRLRNKPGFETLLKKNGDRSFESTYFELVAADILDSSSSSIKFVIPCGIKGQDFDLLCCDFLGYKECAVEVKSRRTSFPSKTALRNFLNAARSQLPNGGVGIIICKIPRDDHYAAHWHVISDIAAWMRTSTTRIKRVLLCCDVFQTEALAVAFARYVIGPNGLLNEEFGARSDVEHVGAISYLSDLGLPHVIEHGLRRTLYNRAAVGVKVIVGKWNSRTRNWWSHNGSEV